MQHKLMQDENEMEKTHFKFLCIIVMVRKNHA